MLEGIGILSVVVLPCGMMVYEFFLLDCWMSCSVQGGSYSFTGGHRSQFPQYRSGVYISLIYDLSGTPCLPLGILYIDGFALV